MSQIAVSTVFDQLETDARDVWAITTPGVDEEENVIRGVPRLGMLAPYAAMRLATGTARPGAVRTRQHTFAIELLGRFLWPVDGTNIETAKESRLNAMMARIEAGSTYGGLINPEVISYEFGESDDPNEPVYEVVLTLQGMQDVPR